MASIYGPSDLVVAQIPPGDMAGGWAKVRVACPELSEWGMSVLRSGLDGSVQSVVIERNYICKDYRNIFSHFYSRKFVGRSPACCRLHFFSTPAVNAVNVSVDAASLRDHYIGYSVIQPTLNSKAGKCLGRTIIDPFKCKHKSSTTYCLGTKFTVQIQGGEYQVKGYPYMSQSGEATVCAHAALWGVCRYLSERYSEYAELYPYDVILMTGNTSGRRVPYHGLSYSDYSTILSNFGAHPVLRHPNTFGIKPWTQDRSTFLDIYSYMESGFPILLSFRGHVATLVGHTMRDTLAFDSPDKHGFHDSYALVDQYVVVDDNFFPYQFLGERADDISRNYGKNFEAQLKPHPSKEDIYAAVVPLPETAFMEPLTARLIGSGYFGAQRALVEGVIKGQGIDPKDPKEPIITRLFLTSSRPFKRRKVQSYRGDLGIGADSLSQWTLKMELPHFVWVMEISTLSLHKKQLAIGEVVIDATADKNERGLVYARIGDRLTVGSSVYSDPKALQAFRHYTHNLGER